MPGKGLSLLAIQCRDPYATKMVGLYVPTNWPITKKFAHLMNFFQLKYINIDVLLF